MHLLKGIGGDKNRPTAKSLTNEQVSGFLTGFSPDAPEQQYKMQPAAAVAPPPQPQQPAQSGMGSPMPAVPKPKSALELRYGGKK